MDSGAGANPREIALRLRRNSVGEMPDSRELESRSEMQGSSPAVPAALSHAGTTRLLNARVATYRCAAGRGFG